MEFYTIAVSVKEFNLNDPAFEGKYEEQNRAFGKTGPKLTSHADGPPCDKPGASPAKDVPSFHFICHTLSPYLDLGSTLMLGSRDVSMDVLAGTLSEALAGPLAFGRPIIDKTGLTPFSYMPSAIGAAEFERGSAAPSSSHTRRQKDPARE